MSVKIMALEAENVKRIKAVALTPSPTGLTIVGGNNNQGKTSVLDALAWALGGDRFRPDAAQRDGAVAPAHLRVKLSNGVVVERKGKNSTLTVTDPTGRRSGQQLLNAFIEPLALDLPRFMEASDKEKADILLRIIGIGTELHTRDLEIKALYDKRTFTGQLAAQKKHFAEELISYPDAPEEPVSASDLIRQQQEILARNGENQRKRQQLDKLIDEKNQLKFTLRDLDEKIEDLKEEYKQTQAKFADLEKQIFQARKSAAQLQDESTAELEASIRDIEETNRKVRANLEKSRAEDEAAQYASDYDKLTEAITRKRADRMALLNGADLPLPELSVEDGALTYKGKHWRDMSGSDQLRVAAAIVRRLNPDCGFVLLDKLEQMDMTTLQEFSAWLEAEHLQAIATRVSTGSECQIIIEDGMVKDAETTLPPVTEKPQQKSWTKGAF
ncbi:MAG: AAA family ATPase [Faecalibacterium sp.]|nr:AAA family ATPase [Faecalibacterium sp.]